MRISGQDVLILPCIKGQAFKMHTAPILTGVFLPCATQDVKQETQTRPNSFKSLPFHR